MILGVPKNEDGEKWFNYLQFHCKPSDRQDLIGLDFGLYSDNELLLEAFQFRTNNIENTKVRSELHGKVLKMYNNIMQSRHALANSYEIPIEQFNFIVKLSHTQIEPTDQHPFQILEAEIWTKLDDANKRWAQVPQVLVLNKDRTDIVSTFQMQVLEDKAIREEIPPTKKSYCNTTPLTKASYAG